MGFNTLIDWNNCNPEQQRELLTRPAISASDSITRTVSDILDNVKTRGDDALREYGAKFDKTEVTSLRVTAEEIAAAGARLSEELKQAMAAAVKNIETFHSAQTLPPVDVETQPGVRCQPGYASRRICRSVYSRRLGSALLNGANAGNAGAHCGMSESGSVLAAAHRR
ncbi:histidinol dehydrogenase [Salmonella enterica subsp. arizonae]|uniref:histidinol dehydrogenase n=1 Tax=Salmonella enterica subsp. arizonae TaxID=59203 RepID=A0A379SSU0_SALER|nr:histidinol dehydrogenase [Salmonella enterica subsp. arizonae]